MYPEAACRLVECLWIRRLPHLRSLQLVIAAAIGEDPNTGGIRTLPLRTAFCSALRLCLTGDGGLLPPAAVRHLQLDGCSIDNAGAPHPGPLAVTTSLAFF